MTIRPLQLNKSFDDYLPLSRENGREIYTRRGYDPMLKELKRLGAIECDPSYKVGEWSKGYRLAAPYRSDIQEVEFHNPKLEKRLAKVAQRRIPNCQPHQWLIETWDRRVTFTDRAADLVRSREYKSEAQRLRYQLAFDRQSFNYMSDERTARVYYSGNQMPRVLRAELLIDGEPTAEIDVSASQPRLCATLYLRPCAEQEQFLSLCDSGLFYERLGEWSDLHLNRDELKKYAFREIFFGSTYSHGPMWRGFSKQFPTLAVAVIDKKVNDKSGFALHLQSIEGRIMVANVAKECATREIPIVSIHDGIRCRERDAEEVANLITTNWTSVTGRSPRLKVEGKTTLQAAA